MSEDRYHISAKANEDLDDIWFFTFQNWSKEQADIYYNLLISEIDFISENYGLGKSLEQIRKDYRVTRMKSHLIFYRKSKKGVVEIVRILHQRMDVKRRL